MSRSIWYILIIGVLTMSVLTVTMFFMLKWFGESSLGKNTKMALTLKSQFKFESVGTDVRAGVQKTVLLVHYETRVDSKFNLSAQTQEMKQVAEFAAGKLEPVDRRKIDEIQVKRTEVRGGGCWQRSYVSDGTYPNPYRGENSPPGAPLPAPK